MRRNLSITKIFASATIALMVFAACQGEVAHIGKAIDDKDTLPTMTSLAVSTLISDSGKIKYRIITEEWDIYMETTPPRWTFFKGLFIEQFDEKYHAEAFIQADSAWCYNQSLWELRGRVFIKNRQGVTFRTEELFWDMNRHEIWSNKYMRIVSPERQLEGTEFRSDERMTHYFVRNSKGAFPVEDTQPTDSIPK